MKLTVNGNEIAIPVNGTVHIEKTSPFNNDDSGSYSLPFAVPRVVNENRLKWPGRLQRSGDLEDQVFILEENGIQLLRGEIDYDEVTDNEIGIILESGKTEFFKKIDQVYLNIPDYGGESWPVASGYLDHDLTAIEAKLDEWDLTNSVDNGKYVMAPFLIKGSYITDANARIIVNNQRFINANNETNFRYYLITSPSNYIGLSFCFQFKINFVLTKIFEHYGYEIISNEFENSEFNNAVLFSNIFTIQDQITNGVERITPIKSSIVYSTLMPEVLIKDFLKMVKDLFCMMYIINDLKKEVQIMFKKNIFLDENIDNLKINELKGWIHKELQPWKGFNLKFGTQEDELDTFSDFDRYLLPEVADLPAPTLLDEMVYCLNLDRCFQALKNEAGTMIWKEIGRLKEVKIWPGENTIEINVKVPGLNYFAVPIVETTYSEYVLGQTGPGNVNFELIDLKEIVRMNGDTLTEIDFLAITLYRGRQYFNGVLVPYLSSEKRSLDGRIICINSISPLYLYNTVYADFINWQTYRARPFTKYIELTMAEVLNLQWSKRYVINGIVVILDTINYELPYYGVVEVKGFTG